jgi:hypothetical protein
MSGGAWNKEQFFPPVSRRRFGEDYALKYLIVLEYGARGAR